MDEGLLTADDLALKLRVRPATVRRWAAEGLIPAIRINDRVIRFEYSAVCAAIRAGDGVRLAPAKGGAPTRG